ncbi:anti-sigma F factor [uncultured Clostridium sp.]|uniref:anti-sigma F factor n=1 Tax=uncultured Clostridium sp. TaxID=59620 RepID=UPI0026316EB1|nr:anti-sigma F factor [uncultured Clostridium sp.]
MYDNKMSIEFLSKSENEGFARVAVSAFVAQLDPTIEEITDIKTAVSEAVTNAIIHGYENREGGRVRIDSALIGNEIEIIISDFGTGIENVEEAKEPLFTSRPDLERSGMGFTVMESFMDSLEVYSEKNKGTRVIIRKKIEVIGQV